MSVLSGPISPGTQVIVWGLHPPSGMTTLSTSPTDLPLGEHRDLFPDQPSSPIGSHSHSNKHTSFSFVFNFRFISEALKPIFPEPCSTISED